MENEIYSDNIEDFGSEDRYQEHNETVVESEHDDGVLSRDGLNVSFSALADKVRRLIQKNKDLIDINEELRADYNEKITKLEDSNTQINKELSEEKEKRQRDNELLVKLVHEIDECLEFCIIKDDDVQ